MCLKCVDSIKEMQKLLRKTEAGVLEKSRLLQFRALGGAHF